MENITQGQWFRGPSADLGDEISQSLRFETGGYLKRAQTGSGNDLISAARTFTFSTWFKHGDMGETNIFGIHSASQENWLLTWANFSNPGFAGRDSGGWGQYSSTAVFRDPNAWYHLFLTCSSGVLSLRVNNVLQDQTDTQNHSMDKTFVIGAEHTNGGSPMDAYLADTYFIQGTVMDAVNDGFIRLNEDGVYVPDTPTISDYGTQGFHLTYDSSQSNGIGHDSSGKNNHFTATSFDTTAISSSNRLNDIDIKDTPTSNYAVFNKLWDHTTPNPKQANQALATAQTITGQVSFRFPPEMTGKYWIEAGTANLGASTNAPALTITDKIDDAGLSGTSWSTTANYSAIGGYHSKYSNFTSSSATSYTTVGGNVGLAIDCDNEEVKMYNNGSLINTDTTVDFSKELAITVMQPNASYDTYEPYINAGQQAFIQTKPTGFKELQTNNLPEPKIKNGREHFDVHTYTSASTAANISFTGWEFQPDLVWIKSTSHGSSHNLFDSVRGATKSLKSNTDTGQGTTAGSLTSFDSNGFSLGTADSDINYNSRTFVAWGWKAGGAPTATNSASAGSAQTAGSVKVDGANSSFAQGSIAVNKMSVNTTAGFSIVDYTGTGSAGTIPHGLGAVPEFAIFKRYDGTAGWQVYHKQLDGNATRAIYLNESNNQQSESSGFWNNTLPTSTLWTLGAGGDNNTNGEDVISYSWTPIPGYSRFGSYTGNGSSGDNGTFVYLGFTPHFLLIKGYSNSGNWMMYDSTRTPQNPILNRVLSNLANQEADVSSQEIDFLSNGFKIRGNDSDVNETYSYVYAAFAANPFGGENTPPATAH